MVVFKYSVFDQALWVSRGGGVSDGYVGTEGRHMEEEGD